jgi:hypothetical protein
LPYALAVPLNDEAVTVVFDLVDPVRARGNLGPAARQAGLERIVTHGRDIGTELAKRKLGQ